MSGRPALFLDRDGVINEEVGYLHRFKDVRFVDGIVPLLQAANQRGYFTCVVTNQAGIGRGLYTEDDFGRLMEEMRRALQAQGATLDAVYHSPFHPEHGIGSYRRDTFCRKPSPGMFLQAIADYGLDPSRSIMVGDRCSDMAAGAAAGVPDLYLLNHAEGCADLRYTAIPNLHAVTLHLNR